MRGASSPQAGLPRGVDRAGGELPPDHGRPFEHGALLAGKPVEAGSEQRVDRGRDRLCRRPSTASASICSTKRITLGAGEDPLSLALIDLCPECFDEALGIVPGERLERNDERAGRVPGRPVLQQLGAREAENKNGASVVQPTRYSRSRNVGSAHWSSSIPRMIGRSRAMCSRKRRTAQNVSSPPGGASSEPTAPASLLRSGPRPLRPRGTARSPPGSGSLLRGRFRAVASR